MKPIFKVAAVAGLLSSVLGGCAVYGPPPTAYAQGPYYQPAPVYVAPAPVYAAPPVSLGFSFGNWGGYGHHHRHW
jgi:hypothetical protein